VKGLNRSFSGEEKGKVRVSAFCWRQEGLLKQKGVNARSKKPRRGEGGMEKKREKKKLKKSA